MNIKNKVIIFVTAILVILVGGGCCYYFAKLKPYNEFLNSANKAAASEEYDKAVTLYRKALNYKKSEDVSKKIELAKLLKKSKENYDTAIKEMNDKKYLEAIDSFKKIDKQDSKRYEAAQGKIEECKKQYIGENIQNANDSFKNSKFDDANNYLNNIFKLDSNNTDALKIKNDIAKATQEQKDKDDKKNKILNLQKSLIGKWSDKEGYMVVTESTVNGSPYKVIFDESIPEKNILIIEVTDSIDTLKFMTTFSDNNTRMQWLYNTYTKSYSGGDQYKRAN